MVQQYGFFAPWLLQFEEQLLSSELKLPSGLKFADIYCCSVAALCMGVKSLSGPLLCLVDEAASVSCCGFLSDPALIIPPLYAFLALQGADLAVNFPFLDDVEPKRTLCEGRNVDMEGSPRAASLIASETC
ncbi:hypothetical protein Nepgr_008058 [Nepenthes gracilis]|uniref:Uncharacterized protein n=1 Tax=Nepenthes gracilis TaxID=150966 RepID=A0AAD3S848_NEPGR|nr:hypothetical protein Nepgr_008058 [Nepenthes gracilis]